jgi:hypothetical protein
MSRFKPRNNNQHPCTLWLEWGGADGKFYYYDKESKSKVSFDLKRFIVLDSLSTIVGYDESRKMGVYSNEVRDTTKQQFIIRNKEGVVEKGLYAEIKDKLPKGIKYAASVYIAVEHNGKIKLANVKLSGAALSSWVDFKKSARIYDGAIEISEIASGKKGAVSYKFPKFVLGQTTPQEEESGKGVWQLLEDYLEAYFGTAPTTPATDKPLTQGEEELLAESDDEDFPF